MKTPVICFVDPGVLAALRRLSTAHLARASCESPSLGHALTLTQESDSAMYAMDAAVSAWAESAEPVDLATPATLDWAYQVLGEGVIFCPKSEKRDRNFLAYFPDGKPSVGIDLPDGVTKSELLAACHTHRLPLKEQP